MFDKAEMMDWEQQPINIKTNYSVAKLHFELKVKAHDMYLQNSSSGATGHNKYESANNMAGIGDKIKDDIVKIANSSITNDDDVANMHEANKKKDAEMAEMLSQIKQLTTTLTKLASQDLQNTESNDINKNHGCRGNRVIEQMTKLRSMGGYCSTHSFHTVGVTHDSATCQYKKRTCTMTQPHGRTASAATPTGPRPSTSRSNSRSTQHGKTSRRPSDRDWGRMMQ